MTLKQLIFRIIIFALPGIFLLAGGVSPAHQLGEPYEEIICYLRIHPHTFNALIYYSILVCLPGIFFILAADYLAEVTMIHGIPLNTTPSAFWVGSGYLYIIVFSLIAVSRIF